MQASDFPAVVQPVLDQQRASLTERLHALFAAHPDAAYFEFEYLLGLDHAILAYARRADDSDLTEGVTVFAGLDAYRAELATYDQQHGTGLANEFRGDVQVAELVDDWFAAAWEAAGGAALPVPSYYRYEGDDSRLDLQTQEWE